MVPIPSGDIPHNQLDEEFSSGCMNLKYTIYPKVKIRPAIIPEMAPSLFIAFVNIPKRRAGKGLQQQDQRQMQPLVPQSQADKYQINLQ